MIQLRQTDTTPTGDEAPGGGFGSGTLVVVLLLVLALFWWNTRRRRAMEERFLAQRREQTIAEAEESARDVARLMRAAPAPGAAEAAASSGLASAATTPAPVRDEPVAEAAAEDQETIAAVRGLERAEAVTEAERAAAEQALQAARAAELAGESALRRHEAGEAVAVETQADTADALRQALRELESEQEAPLGAIRGDGTAVCPPEYPIKGNASSKIYHVPGQVSYPQTIAELCFASGAAAEAAGFRQSRARVARPRP